MSRRSINGSRTRVARLANLYSFFALALAMAVSVLASIGCSDEGSTSTAPISSHSDLEETTINGDFKSYEVLDGASNRIENSLLKDVANPDHPRQGGVLRMWGGNIMTPDPVIGTRATTQRLLLEIYAGLMKIVDDPTTPIQPDLSERYVIDSSGKEYEFVLRRNLKFSDGTPLTASDVKWSWERALNPATRSDRASRILGSIEGADEILAGLTSELAGVQAVDDRVLRVTLTVPRSDFTALLADPVASVLKRENVENWRVDWASVVKDSKLPRSEPDNELPVGAGPFRLAAFQFIQGPCVLVRNEHYHDRPAYLEGIEFTPCHMRQGFDEFSQQDAARFQAGEIDVTVARSVDGSEVPGEVQRSFELAPTTEFLVFNSAIPPLDNVHFRRALVASADTTNFRQATNYLVADGLLPIGFPGYKQETSSLGYDLQLAQEKLAAFDNAKRQHRLEFNTYLWGQFEEEVNILSSGWFESLDI